MIDSPAGPDAEHFCPCCNAAFPQDSLFVVNDCLITRCRCCGVGRSRPRSFNPNAYYSEAYFKGGHADGYWDYEKSEAILRREFRGIVRELAKTFPARARLLEVGCAYGYFLKEAAAHFDVVGIEIAQVAVDACHRAGLKDVHCGTIASARSEELGQFDVIVMFDVIEHLEDPLGDLKVLQGLLRPNGVLLLSTGDFSSRLARLMGPRWRLMTPPQHLWYFTPQALRGLAGQCGLEVVSTRHPWKLVPAALAAFQLERMTGLSSLGVPDFFNRVGIPANLFDAMRMTLRKPESPRLAQT